jgi:hypothetical protein
MGLTVEEVYKMLVEFIESNINHWEIFVQAAEMKRGKRGDANSQSPQYKTEKWFQAEFLYFLWVKKGVRALPEWGKGQWWDLYIRTSEGNKGIFLHLKDFVAVRSCAVDYRTDYGAVKKNLQATLNHDINKGRACMAMLLPKENTKYREGMLESINRDFPDKLEIRPVWFNFDAESKEGFVLVWIEPLQRIVVSQ